MAYRSLCFEFPRERDKYHSKCFGGGATDMPSDALAIGKISTRCSQVYLAVSLMVSHPFGCMWRTLAPEGISKETSLCRVYSSTVTSSRPKAPKHDARSPPSASSSHVAQLPRFLGQNRTNDGSRRCPCASAAFSQCKVWIRSQHDDMC